MNGKPIFVYQEIRKNQIKTFLLLTLFIVIILALSITIGYYLNNIYQGLFIGVMVTIIVVPINLLTSKFFIIGSTKGKKINLDNPDHMRVKNLVEGLSLSAGLKNIPEIYVLPSNIPNAFAGGFSPKSSYIGVTQGLLDIMDNMELEGVIAHEISHIAQYDVLISTVAISLFSVAIILGDMLFRISWYGGNRRSRSNESKGNIGSIILIMSIAAIILSWVIRLIGSLLNLSISRKREYVADANAVRLCGYSKGLASALRKLLNQSKSKQYEKRDLQELGGENLIGLYIFNPIKSITNLFSTHPPIEDRIAKLESIY